MGYATINPFNEQKLEVFGEQTHAEIMTNINRADSTYKRDWSKRALEDRKSVVKRAAALLRERGERMAKLVTIEMGKLIAEARAEVDLSADILDYYADNAVTFLADKTTRLPDPRS
jgi:succinate-semialdehyde dehydrogenase/glutarate-semialdehyde dehydrogenase